jgi:hypothetical protein
MAAWPASAQSTYVGASVVGDVLRTTHSESILGRDVPSGGESVGFALRVGTPIGSRWGVELEFTHPGEIETEFPGPIPLTTRIDSVVSTTTVATTSAPIVYTVLPPFPQPAAYRLTSSQRHSTLSATAWVNQDVSRRVSLVYLAGMGFYRATSESEFRFDVLPGNITAPIVIPSLTKTVGYGVSPLAGFEVRVQLTDHVNIVPGVRLHGLESGWLTRPAVGLEWEF